MVATGSGRSSRRGRASHCAARATTGPTFGPAGAAAASLRSACRPTRRAPTSASTATSCLSASVGAAGGPGPASGSLLARRRVFDASPERRPLARIAARTGRLPPDGPKARCVTPATTPRSADGEHARAAAPSAGWCHLPARAPPAAVTARGSPRCTPAQNAGARTSSTSGAVATGARLPAAPPKR